jgi:hypothetical protein
MSDVLRRFFVVLVVLGLLVGACTIPGNARVSGVVTIDTTCPVGDCPARPMPGIRITFTGASGHSATTVTDSSGAYAITLAPQDYDVGLAGPNALSFEVSVADAPPSASTTIHANSGQNLQVNFRVLSAI